MLTFDDKHVIWYTVLKPGYSLIYDDVKIDVYIINHQYFLNLELFKTCTGINRHNFVGIYDYIPYHQPRQNDVILDKPSRIND